MTNTPPKKQSGFTLVEMSIVLVIVATLTVPLIQAYNAYLNEEKIRITKENIKITTGAMAASDPRYAPCPSDRSIPFGDPNYGLERCNIATIPDCNPGGIPAQGICRVRGSRDTINDGASVNDWIIIGGVPTRLQPPAPAPEIRILKSENALDGWGHVLNYAVSEKVMDHTNTSGAENYKHGAINAQDENGNPTAGVASPKGDAQFVVWSSGANGAGAYSYTGLEISPCPNGVNANQDTENCDNDNTFTQGIGNYEGAGARYFDDTSYFYLQTSGDLWTYASPRTVGAPAQHIYNLNTDKVVISNSPTLSPEANNPLYKLWVEGDISAATVLASQYSTSGGTPSYTSPDGLGLGNGDNRICPSGGVMLFWSTGLSGPMCADGMLNRRAVPAITVTCPAGAWVQGFTSKRCVLCSNGTEQCPP